MVNPRPYENPREKPATGAESDEQGTPGGTGPATRWEGHPWRATTPGTEQAMHVLNTHRWGRAPDLDGSAHTEHTYAGWCAICRGNTPAIIEVLNNHRLITQ